MASSEVGNEQEYDVDLFCNRIVLSESTVGDQLCLQQQAAVQKAGLDATTFAENGHGSKQQAQVGR